MAALVGPEDIAAAPVGPEDIAAGLAALDLAEAITDRLWAGTITIIVPWAVGCGTGLVITEDAAAVCSL